MPYSDRSYLVYVDDSGNEAHRWLWTALALPNELWTDHLRRWLSFRRWLYKQHAVPANFELHAQVWLSPQPSKHTVDQQLGFLESFLLAERAHATLVVDGLNDGGGHLRAAHRALRIDRRRVLEDASHRSSADSQLLQMTDLCAYAALQSIQAKATVDPRFRAQYETTLSRVIVRPGGFADGRSIRGLDYPADRSGCPLERAR